jgi:hypothetical protein
MTLPEMVFGDSKLEVKNEAQGLEYSFKAYEALDACARAVDVEVMGPSLCVPSRAFCAAARDALPVTRRARSLEAAGLRLPSCGVRACARVLNMLGRCLSSHAGESCVPCVLRSSVLPVRPERVVGGGGMVTASHACCRPRYRLARARPPRNALRMVSAGERRRDMEGQ